MIMPVGCWVFFPFHPLLATPSIRRLHGVDIWQLDLDILSSQTAPQLLPQETHFLIQTKTSFLLDIFANESIHSPRLPFPSSHAKHLRFGGYRMLSLLASPIWTLAFKGAADWPPCLVQLGGNHADAILFLLILSAYDVNKHASAWLSFLRVSHSTHSCHDNGPSQRMGKGPSSSKKCQRSLCGFLVILGKVKLLDSSSEYSIQ